MRVGVDTGGTFTDVVGADGRVVKLLSTPADPAQAVYEGVRAGQATEVAHGTTVATNALLERRGGRVALLTTEGHADVVEIARQARPSLYDPWADRPAPLVPRCLRIEVAGRLDAAGKELAPLGEPPALPTGLDAVAVCFLHADRNPNHERTLAARLGAGAEIVLSSEVSPEFRDYERTATTVADAYLRRPCGAYLARLAGLAPDVLVMTSAGGLFPLAEAALRPVRLLLSGPAGGVLAAAAAAGAAGLADCVSFDMGGTSTDVCLIQNGRPAPAAERVVAGFPIRAPALDVHTIGAGGGSLARLDPGGALAVGPQSAGADPGPACYGRGGTQPTVTDADLVAGRIPVERGLGGLGRLDVASARRAMDQAGLTAEGVIAVVDENMAQAVRAVTVEVGVDPEGVALVAFGGAGPLHGCAVADALGMPAVVVPPRAGVLSAVGLLGAPRQEDRVRSWPDPLARDGLDAALSALGKEAAAAVGLHAAVETSLDCRYQGQSHELTVPTVEAFAGEHERRNGFLLPDVPVEVIALRAKATLPSPVDVAGLAAPDRRGPITGPAFVAETDCTMWVPDGWGASVHPSGSWLLTRVP